MKFNVIIIGGGMAGGALACALSKGPWQIALVDAVGEISEDSRLIALNEGSYCLFKNIGIWMALECHAAPIKQVHISHHGHFGITRIEANEVGLDALGHVVPATHINAALFSSLRNTKNVKLIHPATLRTLTQQANIVKLSIDTAQGREEHTADIVIGADGSHSKVRELLGIGVQKTDYQQHALVTITELARDHKNIAYERFQKKGAIAMLPLKGTRAATIWTAPSAHITHLMQLDDTEFLHQLQQQFGYRLGRLKQTGKRAVYPLYMQRAQQQSKQNVLLMGNAAHTLHPIAAQGLNLALYEAAVITEHFLAQKSLSGCLQNLPLNDFQQNFSFSLSHGLTELFAKDLLPFTIARQIGMAGLDQCVLLKKHFVSYAIGKSGRIPRLFLENTE